MPSSPTCSLDAGHDRCHYVHALERNVSPLVHGPGSNLSHLPDSLQVCCISHAALRETRKRGHILWALPQSVLGRLGGTMHKRLHSRGRCAAPHQHRYKGVTPHRAEDPPRQRRSLAQGLYPQPCPHREVGKLNKPAPEATVLIRWVPPSLTAVVSAAQDLANSEQTNRGSQMSYPTPKP